MIRKTYSARGEVKLGRHGGNEASDENGGRGRLHFD